MKKSYLRKRNYSSNFNQKNSYDPQGSYTGTDYDDEYSEPVQDADDL